METSNKLPARSPEGMANVTTLGGCQIIFVLGSPGAGKGTLCKQLVETIGAYHLSVGDHLRTVSASTTQHELAALGGLSREAIHANLKARKLIDPEPLAKIVRHKLMHEQSKGHTMFVIDGFPRSDESAEMFEIMVNKPTKVLLFDCPQDIARDRFLARSREVGDNEVVFAKRYAEYTENNKVIMQRYTGLVETIDTSKTEEDSYQSLLAIFD